MVFPLWAAAFMLLPAGVSFSGDLSDDLTTGDGFSYNNTLKGKANTKFHQAKARGKAKSAGSGDVVLDGKDRDVNFGSVVDSDVKGDVIIIMDDVDATIK